MKKYYLIFLGITLSFSLTSSCFAKDAPLKKTLPQNINLVDFILGEISINRRDTLNASNYFSKLSTSTDDHYLLQQKINLDFTNKKYRDAIVSLDQLLKNNPTDIMVLTLKAKALFNLKKTGEMYTVLNSAGQADQGTHFIDVYNQAKTWLNEEELLSLFQFLSEQNSDNIDALSLYISLLIDKNNSKEALVYLPKLIELDPKRALSYSLFSYANFKNNTPERALDVLDKLEKNNSIDIQLIYLYALINDFQIDKAYDYAKKIAIKNPRNVELLNQILLLSFYEGELKETNRAIQKILNQNGDLSHSLTKLYDYVKESGRYEDLKSIFPQINKTEITQIALLIEARMALLNDQPKDFMSIFSVLHTQFPELSEFFYLQQLDMLAKAGKNDTLIHLIQLNRTLDPNLDFLNIFYEALGYAQKKEFSKMEQLLKQNVTDKIDKAAALNSLGYMILDYNLPDPTNKALEYVMEANDLMPNDPAIMDSLGWALLKNNKVKEASLYLTSAYNQEKSPELIAHYIELLLKKNENLKAMKIFNQLKKYYPNHSAVMYLIETYPVFKS